MSDFMIMTSLYISIPEQIIYTQTRSYPDGTRVPTHIVFPYILCFW